MRTFQYEQMLDRMAASAKREREDREAEEARIAQDAADLAATIADEAEFAAWLAAEREDIKRDEDAFELRAAAYAQHGELSRYFAANVPARHMKEAA